MQQAAAALDALADAWKAAAETARCERREASADELARALCRCLQAQPGLVGLMLKGDWIKAHYTLFCESVGVARPPPYKDFAHKLKDVMLHRRLDRRSRGEGNLTWYRIPPLQAADVVELPTRKRA